MAMSWKSVLAMLARGVGVLGFVGSFVYAICSVVTGAGPGGWVIDLQLQSGGSYAVKLTMFVTWLLVAAAMTPLWVGLAVLRDRLGPTSVPTSAPTRQAAAAPDRPVSLMLSSGLCLLLVAGIVAGGGFLVLHVVHERESGQPFEPVSRVQGLVGAEPSSSYLAIDGLAQTELIYGIGKRGEHSSQDFYVPLTAPGWTTTEAVRYVLVIHDHRGALGAHELRGPFHVVARAGRVPRFVRSAYEKEGLTLASSTYLVERLPVANGKVARSRDGETEFLVGGALVGGLGLLMAIVGFIRQRFGGAPQRYCRA
jgi:hypothetical protein